MLPVMPKPALQIITGSTRPTRVGPSVTEWFRDRALAHDGFDVDVIDLAAVNLPFPEYNYSFPASLKNALDYLAAAGSRA
jgi:NAD(P)H-dependent FMN reductase